MNARPDFLIIGAMKSATTTLHEQLARQPGLFLSRPKEPNYFSDDDVFAQGADWYEALFANAPPNTLRGESSTHYTKLPTYPHTVARIAAALPEVKLIYVMRHPVDRMLSHYVHDRTNGAFDIGLPEAVVRVSELVEYGRYAMQLDPYFDTFGPGSVLPVFFDRLTSEPQAELERIGRFLGCEAPLVWDDALPAQNVGSARLRHSPLREALVQAPVITPIRQRLLPRQLSEPLKSIWRSRERPPEVDPELRRQLHERFDPELERLGGWLGVELNCENFREVTARESLEWALPDRSPNL